MNKFQQKRDQGFTIIEVVLVLAIAGLIFLIVFLAVPQLQRSRRDTQRRSDVSRVLAELNNYASNNGGQYPDTTAEVASFSSSYLDGLDLDDPSLGTPYTYARANVSSGVGNMAISGGGECNGEVISGGTGDRKIAVVVTLDNGTNSYCLDIN